MSEESRYEPFSMFNSPIGNRVIIEASAGTGKTYTVTGLFIRLLLERKTDPDKILVVTFTRLATKELKDRIYNLLKRALHAMETGREPEEELVKELIDSYGRGTDVQEILRNTLRNMDEVTISTIHGFCQQVLQEEALLSGATPELELLEEDKWLREATADYWRSYIDRNSRTREGRFLLEQILNKINTPDSLVQLIRPVVMDRNQPMTSDSPADPDQFIAELLQTRDRMKELWVSDRQEILDQIIGSDVGRVSRYLDSRTRKMETFLYERNPRMTAPESLVYFTTSWFRSNLKKNKTRLPEHSFFDQCETYSRLISEVPGLVSGFLEEAIQSIGQLRQKRLSAGGGYTYDDLLYALDRALRAESSGDRLAARLRERYNCALVDEFQDTDPVQYRIFDTIYPDYTTGQSHALLMIGDPKQSIYAFRGADLYTYLKAREDNSVQNRYTLRKNYRSRPALVEAVNHLFSPDHGTPFLEPAISYRTVQSARQDLENAYRVDGSAPVPLTLMDMSVNGNKQQVKEAIITEMVRQVRELLELGRAGRATICDLNSSERPVSGGDIAILVQSHAVGDDIRRRLGREGIRTVSWSRESIFNSYEAERLIRLFRAILDPADLSSLTEALSTGFFTCRLNDLYDLKQDPKRLSELRDRFYELRDLWFKAGIQMMARTLFFEMGGMQTISRFEQSERVITNLQQLLDLASLIESQHQFDPPALFRWFSDQLKQPDGSDEEQLRLESDENLVRISTIHNSKGLQFPIVFCPSLCMGREPQQSMITICHQEEFPYSRVVNLEQGESEDRNHVQARAFYEHVAEEVRKTYVAITRAQYECRLFWGGTAYGHYSGLGALLRGGQQIREDLANNRTYRKSKEADPAELTAGIRSRLSDLEGRLEWRETDETISSGSLQEAPTDLFEPLEPARYTGPAILVPQRSRYNFSSLVRWASVTEEEPSPGEDDDFTIMPRPNGREEREPDQPLTLFHFPRGKDAGTFLHKLFEHPDLDFRNDRAYDRIVADVSAADRVDEQWHEVLEELLRTVPLCDYGPLKLFQVAPDQMISEMEFSFPVREPDVNQLYKLIRSGEGCQGTGDRGGYMNGFIDLVVRHKGVYYILDYKSNDLGSDPDAYRPNRLGEVMREAGYDLQYHLYVAALRRFLKLADPGFSYKTNFGGVFYLFLRGMKKECSNGIYHHRPTVTMMDRIEEVLNHG